MQDNVTQADRERAAKRLRREGEPSLAEMVVNAAFDDHPLVQDFAAHRLASTTAQTEAVQKLVEALEKAIAFYDNLSRRHDEGEAKLLDEMAAILAAHRESQP